MSTRSQQKVTFQHFLPPGGLSGKQSDLAGSSSAAATKTTAAAARRPAAAVAVFVAESRSLCARGGNGAPTENKSLASYKNILMNSSAARAKDSSINNNNNIVSNNNINKITNNNNNSITSVTNNNNNNNNNSITSVTNNNNNNNNLSLKSSNATITTTVPTTATNSDSAIKCRKTGSEGMASGGSLGTAGQLIGAGGGGLRCTPRVSVHRTTNRTFNNLPLMQVGQ